MRRISGSEGFPKGAAAPVVALGNFDGVHLGHRRIIERAVATARSLGGSSVVYTFDPHPVRILAPAECPPLIETLEQRLSSIESLGVDFCVVEPFTAGLAAMGAEEFFLDIVAGRIGARAVVVGYDFTFGARRKGTADLMRELGAGRGIEVVRIEAQFLEDKLVSSTNIRRLIEHGEVCEAEKLLTRPYAIEGFIVPGRGIGRRLSARTANIDSENECIPANCVYLTLAEIEGKSYPSVTSIGDNPTFPHAPFAIEAHLIDRDVDVMGKRIRLLFLRRMREQVAFASEEELKEQIMKDIEKAREMHRDRDQ